MHVLMRGDLKTGEKKIVDGPREESFLELANALNYDEGERVRKHLMVIKNGRLVPEKNYIWWDLEEEEAEKVIMDEYIKAGVNLKIFTPPKDNLITLTPEFREHFDNIVKTEKMNIMVVALLEAFLDAQDEIDMSQEDVFNFAVVLDYLIAQGMNNETWLPQAVQASLGLGAYIAGLDLVHGDQVQA